MATRSPSLPGSRRSARKADKGCRLGHSDRLPAPARPQLPAFGVSRVRVLQILGVETFSEPVVDRGQQIIGILASALALPQTCQAYRCAQLPGLGLLAACPVERGEEGLLGG